MKQRILIVPDTDPDADGVWITWKQKRNADYNQMRCPKGYHTPRSGHAPYRNNRKRDNLDLQTYGRRT